MADSFLDKDVLDVLPPGLVQHRREHKSMSFVLSRATGREAEVRAFRRDIASALQAYVDSAQLEPLPHSFYIFAYENRDEAPVGMIEFYFYEDAFTCYEDAFYAQAYDLAKLGPMHELVHVRSVIVNHPRRAFLFVHLCSAMMETAFALGKRYMTVMTTDDQRNAAMHLYQDAGMTRLGTCLFQGAEQVLFGADVAQAVQVFSRLRRQRSFVDVRSFAAQIAVLRSGQKGQLLRAS